METLQHRYLVVAEVEMLKLGEGVESFHSLDVVGGEGEETLYLKRLLSILSGFPGFSGPLARCFILLTGAFGYTRNPESSPKLFESS